MVDEGESGCKNDPILESVGLVILMRLAEDQFRADGSVKGTKQSPGVEYVEEMAYWEFRTDGLFKYCKGGWLFK